MSNPLKDINLLPKMERSTSSHYPIFIGLLIALVLAYGLIGFFYFTTKNQLNDEQVTYTQISQENELLAAQIDQSISGDDVNITDIFSFIEGVDMRTSYFLDEVDELMPEKSYLSTYEYNSYASKLTVHFETFDAVAAYTTNLNESPFATDVFVNDIHTFNPMENRTDDYDQYLHEIPRHEATFTIDLNERILRGAHERHE